MTQKEIREEEPPTPKGYPTVAGDSRSPCLTACGKWEDRQEKEVPTHHGEPRQCGLDHAQT